MKIIRCEQGSIEWMRARLGMPTASQFDRIITPKTRKPSGSRPLYRAECLAEWLMGQPIDWGTSAYMERGTEWEDKARQYYAMIRNVDVETPGFILRDDELAGGSPDGLVGSDGGLEIKCPGAVQHVRNLLGADPEYTGQIQGYMYLTGRAWWDFLSYNPELPPVIRRIERDDTYISALIPVLDEFIGQLAEDKQHLAAYRVPRPWDEDPEPEARTVETPAAPGSPSPADMDARLQHIKKRIS